MLFDSWRESAHEHRVASQLAHVAWTQFPHLGGNAELFHQRFLGEMKLKRIISGNWHDQTPTQKLGQWISMIVQEQRIVGKWRHGNTYDRNSKHRVSKKQTLSSFFSHTVTYRFVPNSTGTQGPGLCATKGRAICFRRAKIHRSGDWSDRPHHSAVEERTCSDFVLCKTKVENVQIYI